MNHSVTRTLTEWTCTCGRYGVLLNRHDSVPCERANPIATIQTESIRSLYPLYRVFWDNECVLETYDRGEAEALRNQLNAPTRNANKEI